MHFAWFSMWDGFFSQRVSESRPSRVATRVGFGDEWWEIHLTWKTIQNAFSRILYTLRHFNQAKYNVQSCRSWKPCEMDLSHNCSLHGGRSEVCENRQICNHYGIFCCISINIVSSMLGIKMDISDLCLYWMISLTYMATPPFDLVISSIVANSMVDNQGENTIWYDMIWYDMIWFSLGDTE